MQTVNLRRLWGQRCDSPGSGLQPSLQDIAFRKEWCSSPGQDRLCRGSSLQQLGQYMMTFPRLYCALPKHLPAPPENPKDVPSDDKRHLLCTEVSFVEGFRTDSFKCADNSGHWRRSQRRKSGITFKGHNLPDCHLCGWVFLKSKLRVFVQTESPCGSCLLAALPAL